MIDTPMQSSDLVTLQSFTSLYQNVLPIVPGRAAIIESTDADGNTVSAQPAVGDTSLYYTSVRTDSALTLPDGIKAADVDVVTELCGVWA